jgi:RNA recognition motif-containing protein
MSIYVGNLSYQVTEDALKEVFQEYGMDLLTESKYPLTGKLVVYGVLPL